MVDSEFKMSTIVVDKLLSASSWFSVDSFSSKTEIKLKKELVSSLCEEGDIVFDPFMNNGETLFACNNSSRNGICISFDNESVMNIRNKLDKLESQLQLSSFGAKQNSKQLALYSKLTDLEYTWKQYDLPEIDLVVSFLPSLQDLDKLIKQYGFANGGPVRSEFIKNLFLQIKDKIKFGSYVVLLINNQYVNGEYVDFKQRLIDSLHELFIFKMEKIVCIENNASGFDPTNNLESHKSLLFFRKVDF